MHGMLARCHFWGIGWGRWAMAPSIPKLGRVSDEVTPYAAGAAVRNQPAGH
jgi:hypothetical protein